MHSVSYAHITPPTDAAEAPRPSPTGTSPQRRVMRAAWALHRDRGGSFAEALKLAWRHERAQAALSAVNALRGQVVEAAYIDGITREVQSAIPVEHWRMYSSISRHLLADLIERLVNVLDLIDGAADDEPDAPEYDADDEPDHRDLPLLSFKRVADLHEHRSNEDLSGACMNHGALVAQVGNHN